MQPANHKNENRINQGHNAVWLTAFVLAVLVAATISVVGTCIYRYARHSDCEISLYQGQIAEPVKTAQSASTQKAANPVIRSEATQYKGSQAKQQTEKSAFDVKDYDQVWKTETAIELFKSDYTNADGVVTVKSADGRKVIAPGTEGSYTFSLKNTSDASADYKIWVEADISSDMTGVPLETRMSCDSGWLLGGKNSWEKAEDLNGVSTAENIGAGKTAEYTIYWQWPFEQGDDPADTHLGNISADQSTNQELSYTVTIYTLTSTAAESADQTQNSLFHPAKTGDNAQVILWTVVLAVSAGILIVLLILRKRKNEQK